MKISIGCDHGGFKAKESIKAYLIGKGYDVVDCGTFSEESCDYPVFAAKAAKMVSEKQADKGILICSSGEGVCIVANKIKGVRCGIGYNDDVSHLIVEHNHANMISFGAKFMDLEDIKKRIDIFLDAKPLDGRHLRRVEIIDSLDK